VYSSEKSRGTTASVIEFLVTVVVSLALLVYLSLAAYTKDGLWFWPVFNAQPSAIIIYCYGNPVSLDGQSQAVQDLADLINTQISGDKRWDTLNLTNDTYNDYITTPSFLVMEFVYSRGQRIHSASPFFTGFTSLILPVDARHSETNTIFGLINNKPAGGSYHLETISPIKNYLAQSGLCIKP
jgi:hypothetical protein